MLVGSTSGLGLSPAPSTLPCRLRQAQQLFLRGKIIQRTRISRNRVAQYVRGGENGMSGHHSERDIGVNPVSKNGSVLSIQTSLPLKRACESKAGSLPSHVKEYVAAVDVGSRPAGMSSNTPHLEQKSRPLQDADQTRQKLLAILLTAPTIPEAWKAYEDLMTRFPFDPLQKPSIPYRHLHRLASLLASSQPRTRHLFLQLSSVLTTLRRTGGHVGTWEWNALIDCAGKHWRKTNMADYRTALDIFHDMTAQLRPAENSLSPATTLRSSPFPATTRPRPPPAEPDVITYTTLLDIALRSKLPSAIRHALSLLQSSGLSANRTTYLSMLAFYARENRLTGLRSILRTIDEQGMELGLDGLNICIWGFASSGRIDVALAIYRVVRSNVAPETSPHLGGGGGDDDIAAVARYLRETECIAVPSLVGPGKIMYTCLIQCLAYQGHIVQALAVFLDMLSNPEAQGEAPVSRHTGVPLCYPPSMVVFRAIFLGFRRHARRPCSVTSNVGPDPPLEGLCDPSLWSLANLKLVFKAFMDLPKGEIPGERVLYWIMVSFVKLGGDDLHLLHQVWVQLEGKYGHGRSKRLERIRRAIYSSPKGQ